MSEFAGKDHDNLIEHEAELKLFLDTMHASIDNASRDYDVEERNAGQLMVPYGDHNLLACKWKTERPTLPRQFDAMLPFVPGEEVMIHTRLWHGVARALVNVWVSNVEEPFRNFSISHAIDPETGEPKDSIMNSAGGHKDSPRVDAKDVQAVLDVLFQGNTVYLDAAQDMTMGDRYVLGILSQPDHCEKAQPYVVEKGEKVFATAVSSNGFELTVSRYRRLEDEGEMTTTKASLRRDFAPSEDEFALLYSGFLKQEIIIDQDVAGNIVSATRESNVMLFDDPAVTQVNGKESMVVMATKHGSDLPQELQEKLYPDDVPTLEDLAFFTRLTTQPITEQDTYI